LQALERDLRSLAAGNEQRAASLDAWLGGGLNNAHLASIATYWNCVPAFERELAAIDADLPRFYAAVKRLAKLPAADREARLCGTVTGLGRAATAMAPE
jgi:predicted aminopeptidase